MHREGYTMSAAALRNVRRLLFTPPSPPQSPPPSVCHTVKPSHCGGTEGGSDQDTALMPLHHSHVDRAWAHRRLVDGWIIYNDKSTKSYISDVINKGLVFECIAWLIAADIRPNDCTVVGITQHILDSVVSDTLSSLLLRLFLFPENKFPSSLHCICRIQQLFGLCCPIWFTI